ncbi:MAG: hypothetical protein GEU28_00900 [Dehalococcoidia bacterium]|nr:hypothetical protein [Dehalococcoidia bacterium]
MPFTEDIPLVQLIIVRHGPAGEHLDDPVEDARRSLTSKGRKQTRRAMKGIANIVPSPMRILTSPLPRASETAQLLLAAVNQGLIAEDERLAPEGDGRALINQIKDGWGVIAIVGHDPELSMLTSMLPTGGQTTFVALDKGGAAALTYAGGVWTLDWLATRDQLAAQR